VKCALKLRISGCSLSVRLQWSGLPWNGEMPLVVSWSAEYRQQVSIVSSHRRRSGGGMTLVVGLPVCRFAGLPVCPSNTGNKRHLAVAG
jgi:hypothetical protein